METEHDRIIRLLNIGLQKLPDAHLTEEDLYFLDVVIHLGQHPNKVFREIFCNPIYEENDESRRKWKVLDFLHRDGYIQIRRESPSDRAIAEYHFHPQLLSELEKLYPDYFQDFEQEI